MLLWIFKYFHSAEKFPQYDYKTIEAEKYKQKRRNFPGEETFSKFRPLYLPAANCVKIGIHSQPLTVSVTQRAFFFPPTLNVYLRSYLLLYNCIGKSPLPSITQKTHTSAGDRSELPHGESAVGCITGTIEPVMRKTVKNYTISSMI